jgi:hypothetical protein
MRRDEPERSQWERTTSLSEERGRAGVAVGLGCGTLALIGIGIIIALITRDPTGLEMLSAIPGDGTDPPSKIAHRKPKHRRLVRLRRWWHGGEPAAAHEDVAVQPDDSYKLKPAPRMRRIDPQRLRRREGEE